MTEFYFSSTLMWGSPLADIIAMAETLDFAGVELWMEQFTFQKGSAEEVTAALHRHKRKLLVHSYSWDLNLCSLNDHIRSASAAAVEEAIRLAEAVGCREITVHPGRETVRLNGGYAYDDKLAEVVNHLAAYGRERNVMLSLEMMEPLPRELLTSPRVMNSFIERLEVPVEVTFDVAHCLNDDRALHYITALKGVSKIHISNKLGLTRHTPLAEGDLSFPFLLPILMDTGYPLVLEGIDLEPGCPRLRSDAAYLDTIGRHHLHNL